MDICGIMEDMGIYPGSNGLLECEDFRELVIAGWTIRSIRVKLSAIEGKDLSPYSDIELIIAARSILKES